MGFADDDKLIKLFVRNTLAERCLCVVYPSGKRFYMNSDSSNIFAGFSSLKSISLGSGPYRPGIRNVSEMFTGCESLEEVSLYFRTYEDTDVNGTT